MCDIILPAESKNMNIFVHVYVAKIIFLLELVHFYKKRGRVYKFLFLARYLPIHTQDKTE